MQRSLVFLALVAISVFTQSEPSVAQTKTHKWVGGMCEYVVRYDAKKVDAAALKNTAALLGVEQTAIPIAPFAGSPTDAAKRDPATFEKDCEAQAARIRAFELLPIDGLSAYRDERARQFDDACLFGSSLMRAYSEPSALRRYKRASPHCDVYVDAIEGRSDLTALWQKRIREECSQNASPAECRKRNESQGNGPNGDAWKRHYLVGYGWNNCATSYTSFNDASGERAEKSREKLFKAFSKAYRVKETCEEP